MTRLDIVRTIGAGTLRQKELPCAPTQFQCAHDSNQCIDIEKVTRERTENSNVNESFRCAMALSIVIMEQTKRIA